MPSTPPPPSRSPAALQAAAAVAAAACKPSAKPGVNPRPCLMPRHSTTPARPTLFRRPRTGLQTRGGVIDRCCGLTAARRQRADSRNTWQLQLLFASLSSGRSPRARTHGGAWCMVVVVRCLALSLSVCVCVLARSLARSLAHSLRAPVSHRRLRAGERCTVHTVRAELASAVARVDERTARVARSQTTS